MKRQPETRHASLVLSSFPTTFVSTISLSSTPLLDPRQLTTTAIFVHDGICVLRKHQNSFCFPVGIVTKKKRNEKNLNKTRFKACNLIFMPALIG